jgi:hypothetical protein
MGQGHNMRVERAACTRLAAVVLGVLTIAALAGCAAPVQRQAPELRREASKVPRIVVMPLDVELAQLTAGGMDEPHAEWTEAALKHMHAALDDEARTRNVKLVDFQSDRGSPEDRQASLDLVKLHRAVGGAVLVHQYLPTLALPSKEGKFDWSLGPSVTAIARARGRLRAVPLRSRQLRNRRPRRRDRGRRAHRGRCAGWLAGGFRFAGRSRDR